MFPRCLQVWRPIGRRGRYLFIATYLALSLYLWSSLLEDPILSSSNNGPSPIDKLIEEAQTTFAQVLEGRSNTVRSAAARYRIRRGRHPPPGFDAWYEYAQTRNAIIVEDFFDQIYHDLEPFWGLPAKYTREAAAAFQPTAVSVRNGIAIKKDGEDRVWMNLWFDLVNSIAETQMLPDVDLPMNVNDESRLFAPWEDINKYVAKGNATKDMPESSKVVRSFSGLANLKDPVAPPAEWIEDFRQMWPAFRDGCPPESPARRNHTELDLSIPAVEYLNGLSKDFPPSSYYGYIYNWTTATDPCTHAHLRGLHGSFVEPQSTSITKTLIPLMGGSKLSRNNEILIPPAMYWSDDEHYSGGIEHGVPWEKKISKVVWRGSGTGGRNREHTWPHFQRHRLMSMMNGTTVAIAEKQQYKHLEEEHKQQKPLPSHIYNLDPNSTTFVLPPPHLYNVDAHRHHRLGSWLSHISDPGFTDLLCFPHEDGPRCSYTAPYYNPVPDLPMRLQYNYKLLPDVDGNSFSGRYRGFLRSSSLPLKATIYREWHDSRLFPWIHFVPLDNTYADLYGLIQYFLGTGRTGRGARDDKARKIALDGMHWAEKVLRKEDMQIYVYRLILEFARVCDDKRALLGWVEDLKAGKVQ